MTPISTLPKYELDNFCRWLARATEKYFENPDVQKRFAEWQKANAESEDHE